MDGIDGKSWAKWGEIVPWAVYSCLLLLGTSQGTLKWFNKASTLSVHCMLSDRKPSSLTRTH